MKHIEKIEDFPPRTQAFLRESGFHQLDQLVGHERTLALFAASLEVSLPEGSQWREGRPPSDDGTYLVANDRGQVCPVVRGIVQNNVGSAWDWDYGSTLTHWQPMPEPVRVPQPRNGAE